MENIAINIAIVALAVAVALVAINQIRMAFIIKELSRQQRQLQQQLDQKVFTFKSPSSIPDGDNRALAKKTIQETKRISNEITKFGCH